MLSRNYKEIKILMYFRWQPKPHDCDFMAIHGLISNEQIETWTKSYLIIIRIGVVLANIGFDKGRNIIENAGNAANIRKLQ